MSQNLVGIAKKYKGKWYVFPETAEEVVGDKEKYIGPDDDVLLADNKYWVKKPRSEWKRELDLDSRCTLGPYDSLEEAIEESPSDFFDGYFEYGVSASDYIDDIKLVLVKDGKEVEEDKSADEDPLERRVQNLESALKTQQCINLKLVALISKNTELIEDLSGKINLPSSPKGEEKIYKRTYDEYANLVDEALDKGDLMKALEISFETELVSKEKTKEQLEALKRIKDYYNKQNWNKRKGEYTVADWFCLQPVRSCDVDGEEITEDKTLINELPLMTRRQAWKLINDKLVDLSVYLGV